MDDGSAYFEVKALRAVGARPVLSPSSLEVHLRVIDHLAHTTLSNFIADGGLDELAAGPVTTMAAIELSLAGWWRRIDGGYVVDDLELVHAMSRSPRRRRFRAFCRRLWTTLNSESVIPF